MQAPEERTVAAFTSPRAHHTTGTTWPLRQRLLDRLFEESSDTSSRRLIAVCAPMGYGKSRTVAAWIGDGRNRTGSGAAHTTGNPDTERERVIWLRCAPDSPAMLWEALTAELASHRTHDSTPHTPENSAAGYADATIIRLARSLQHPVTLVIDDYHHLSDQVNDLAIAELSAAAPQLSIVVIARRLALLDGSLISARTRVRVIGPADLALSDGETHELAASLGSPQSEHLEFALEQCEGWPLAVAAALQMGSDHLYLSTPHGRVWNPAADPRAFDPVKNLAEFALDHLELLDPHAREVILATAQIDTISLAQAAALLATTPEAALAVVQQLLDRGLLVEVRGSDSTSYRIHRSVKAPLSAHAIRTLDFAARKSVYRERAKEIELTAPFTAFRLYCAAEEYEAAEIQLAHNFSVITDETEISTPLLRNLPEEVLVAHPTFIGALLFLELPQTSTAPSTIQYLIGLWHQGLKLRLPQGSATPPGPIHMPLLCQAMVLTRLLGRLEDSNSLMQHIESRLIPARVAEQDEVFGQIPLRTVMTFAGSLPTYFREAAATALMVGDFERATRNLQKLQQHAERKIAKPWYGFPFASTRTVTDTQSGSRWVLTALSELAFTYLIDGDMNRVAEVLADLDHRAEESHAAAPGISWVGGEIARTHLAYERHDTSLLERANAKLTPLNDRLEPWQLLLLAHAASVRCTQGPSAALAHLQASLKSTQHSRQPHNKWSEYLTMFEAMLCSTIGDLQQATHLIDSHIDAQVTQTAPHAPAPHAPAPSPSPQTAIEQARRVLYSGNDIEAMARAQSIGTPGTTTRQRVDLQLILAVAAWNSNQHTAALSALRTAATEIERYGLPSMLLSVPYAALRDMTVSAIGAGANELESLLHYIDRIPPIARSRRYERLTEMEQRTLAAIAEHRNANQAAAALFVTPGTVKKHLAAVYRKLGAKNRDEAILHAHRMGLIA